MITILCNNWDEYVRFLTDRKDSIISDLYYSLDFTGIDVRARCEVVVRVRDNINALVVFTKNINVIVDERAQTIMKDFEEKFKSLANMLGLRSYKGFTVWGLR